MFACDMDHIAVVKLLLAVPDINVNVRDKVRSSSDRLHQRNN